MTIKDIELRGRKEILDFMGLKWWPSARRRLNELGLLCYDSCGRPVVNKESYRIASMERHSKK